MLHKPHHATKLNVSVPFAQFKLKIVKTYCPLSTFAFPIAATHKAVAIKSQGLSPFFALIQFDGDGDMDTLFFGSPSRTKLVRNTSTTVKLLLYYEWSGGQSP
jgi:hypothetical protein